jgi:hypothetical protein
MLEFENISKFSCWSLFTFFKLSTAIATLALVDFKSPFPTPTNAITSPFSGYILINQHTNYNFKSFNFPENPVFSRSLMEAEAIEGKFKGSDDSEWHTIFTFNDRLVNTCLLALKIIIFLN